MTCQSCRELGAQLLKGRQLEYRPWIAHPDHRVIIYPCLRLLPTQRTELFEETAILETRLACFTSRQIRS